VSNAFLSKYSLLFFLLTVLVIPLLASADELVSTITETDQQSQPKQETMNETSVEFNSDYLKGYVTDLKNIVVAPASWDSSDWITAGIVTGIAVGLYDNDAKIQKWVQNHKTTTTNNIGDNVTFLGFGKYTPVLLGGMYMYGHVADDGKMRKTVLLSVESFVLTGVFVQVLKYSTHRHRPYTEDGPYAWDGPRLHGSNDSYSFPSGHASSAFAIATVIASEYDNYWVPSLAYGIAAITSFNRVSHSAHWSSDAFIGSAIGYFTGKAIVAFNPDNPENKLGLAPMAFDGGLGMVLTYRF
jgi:membrane-associated phospholipid phosphatase